MAFQLEFSEERVIRSECGRVLGRNRGPGVELRRAYDALMDLSAIGSSATHQPLEEYRQFYLEAIHAYRSGDQRTAETIARAVRHLCRAAWFDAKLKHLESHADDLPHLATLIAGSAQGIREGMQEVVIRLSRLRLTGLSDRFGSRARKHLERIEALGSADNLLADTYMKAAYEYCMATEVLHGIELQEKAA